MKTLTQYLLLLCLALGVAGCATNSYEPDPVFTTNGLNAAASSNSEPANISDFGRFNYGDVVVVNFSGGPADLQMPPHEERVTEDGTITLNLVGSIKALGKTPSMLQKEIHDKYVPAYYKRLTVTVRPFEQFFYVEGYVRQSGRFPYSGEMTVRKAITTAGGFSEFADRKNIRLIRANNTELLIINADKLEKNPSEDPKVLPGDQIEVKLRRF
jgi:protein involved in polysaccharide export with SLBB domain